MSTVLWHRATAGIFENKTCQVRRRGGPLNSAGCDIYSGEMLQKKHDDVINRTVVPIWFLMTRWSQLLRVKINIKQALLVLKWLIFYSFRLPVSLHLPIFLSLSLALSLSSIRSLCLSLSLPPSLRMIYGCLLSMLKAGLICSELLKSHIMQWKKKEKFQPL